MTPVVTGTACGVPLRSTQSRRDPSAGVASVRTGRLATRRARQQAADEAAAAGGGGIRRREPQGAVRHEQRVLDRCGRDLRRGRHARAQAEVVVVDDEHRRVGDDVGRGRGAVGHARHVGGVITPGPGIDRERRRLPVVHAADVGFVDIDLELHLPQVFGDLEERGHLQRRRHRLAGLDRALQHDAVDGGTNRGLRQVGAIGVERRTRLGHRRRGTLPAGLGAGERGLAGVHLGLRRHLAGRQREHLAQAVERRRGLLHRGVGLRQLRFRRHQRRLGAADSILQLRRVELGQYLALLDARVVVDEHGVDQARQLRADVDGVRGSEGAGRRDLHMEAAARGRLGHVPGPADAGVAAVR